MLLINLILSITWMVYLERFYRGLSQFLRWCCLEDPVLSPINLPEGLLEDNIIFDFLSKFMSLYSYNQTYKSGHLLWKVASHFWQFYNWNALQYSISGGRANNSQTVAVQLHFTHKNLFASLA